MPYKIIDKRKEAALISAIGPGGGAGHAVAQTALSTLAAAYGAAMAHRTKTLQKKPVQKVKQAKVISVGNITLGGTGKTPVCMHLSELLASKNIKTGISTRGYGRRSDGPRMFTRLDTNATWEDAGDEPVLYLRRGHADAVAVDPDRFRAAVALDLHFDCRAIILDDGFQFITLHKDWNIVTLNAAEPFGNGKLIPRGTLREPVESLSRANLFWLTRAGGLHAEDAANTRKLLEEKFPGVPIVESDHQPAGFYALPESGENQTVTKTVTKSQNSEFCNEEAIRDKKAVALSAIGSPASFEQTIHELSGRSPLAYRFTDHHPFTTAELREVETQARAENCEIIVTTEKDETRIPPGFTQEMPWLILRIGIKILTGQEHIDKIVTV